MIDVNMLPRELTGYVSHVCGLWFGSYFIDFGNKKITSAKERTNKMNIMEINMATAQDYINDYLTNSSMNPSDWDVYWAASDMIDFMTANNIEDYDDVPADTFTEILENNAN